MNGNMSKVVFEMICLSNEIRYYVRRLSKKLGVTVNEFLVLNIMGISNCKTEKEIRTKLYIGHTLFLKTIEKLLEKEYVVYQGNDDFGLSKSGKKVLKEMSKETTDFFEYILAEEDKSEELIRELSQKISDINVIEKEDQYLN